MCLRSIVNSSFLRPIVRRRRTSSRSTCRHRHSLSFKSATQILAGHTGDSAYRSVPVEGAGEDRLQQAQLTRSLSYKCTRVECTPSPTFTERDIRSAPISSLVKHSAMARLNTTNWSTIARAPAGAHYLSHSSLVSSIFSPHILSFKADTAAHRQAVVSVIKHDLHIGREDCMPCPLLEVTQRRLDVLPQCSAYVAM